jgi:dolichol kinase
MPYSPELLRKLIHLSNIWIVLLYANTDKATILYILLPLTIVSIAIDLMRHRSPAINNIIENYFGKLLRDEEHKNLTGASYFLVSSSIVILLFNQLVAINAILILILADTAAALVGKRCGKHMIYRSKTLEGSLAFIATGMLVNILLLDTSHIIALVITAACEVYASYFKLDDNLVIPMVYALLMIL